MKKMKIVRSPGGGNFFDTLYSQREHGAYSVGYEDYTRPALTWNINIVEYSSKLHSLTPGKEYDSPIGVALFSHLSVVVGCHCIHANSRAGSTQYTNKPTTKLRTGGSKHRTTNITSI